MPQVVAEYETMTGNAQQLDTRMQNFFNSKDGKAALAKMYTGYGDKKVSGQEAFMKACMKSGPFDTFENLDPNLRLLAANKQIERIKDKIMNAQNPEELSQWLIEEGYHNNPAMRLGLAKAYEKDGFAGKDKDFFRNIDSALSQKTFEDTLAPMTKEEQDAYILGSGNGPQAQARALENIQRHQESQKVMLKMLYAAQMGDSKRFEEHGSPNSTPWKGNVADMFLSGQRVGIVLPGVTETQRDSATLRPGGGGQPDATNPRDAKAKREQIVSSIYGPDRGRAAGNNTRTSATHSVQTKSFSLRQMFKEIKVKMFPWNLGKLFGGQYGMDVAAGGLGKPGPGGRIENDGTCGHMYNHINPGDSKNCGALLVGFESESPLKTNRLGHTHGMSAKPEQASCFGTQKTNTVGAKYGGREIDLSHIKPDDFIRDMEAFDKYITSRQQNLRHENAQVRQQAQEDLAEVGKLLAGEVVDRTTFGSFRATIKATAVQPISLGPDDFAPEPKKEVQPEQLGRQSKPLPKTPVQTEQEKQKPPKTKGMD